jgi:hypothetical protein
MAARRASSSKLPSIELVDYLVTAYREKRVDDVGRFLAELSEQWIVRVIRREDPS